MPERLKSHNSPARKQHIVAAVVERDKTNRVAHLLKEMEVLVQLQIFAEGTATSNILDLMGLGSSSKSLILCLVPEDMVIPLISTLSEKFELKKKEGRGIAYSIPLSGAGVTGLKPEYCDRWEKWQDEMETEVKQMNEKIEYDLIVAVVDEGGSDDLMEAARGAGATGGTLMHALRIGMEDSKNFFGIPIQAKKEVVTILTKRENKRNLIQTLANRYEADSHTLIFSLPVDHVSKFEKPRKETEENAV